MRHLFSTRRHVPLDLADEYLAAWVSVRTAAANADGRAWVFRGATHEDRFLEFIEWDGEALPLDDAAVTAALAQLERFAPATESAEWEEAT